MTVAAIIFGTETGNAEIVADEVCEALATHGIPSTVKGMEDCDVETLAQERFVVLVTSTYGEGDLPETSKPFCDALVQERPDLSSVHFAAFGLGDSTYENFNNAIVTVAGAVSKLGAVQIGVTARHDSASGLPTDDIVRTWVNQIVAEYRDVFGALTATEN
jgi:MioC protein